MANTRKFTAAFFVLVLAVLGSSSPAAAGSNPMLAAAGATSIPIGHMEFCRARPAECSANGKVVEAMPLDERRWGELLAVNTYFNKNIVPITDADLYKVAEFWTYPNGYGDCEDIALAKRRELIAEGWPASTLLMTVVKEPNGEGHAVLLVRTDRGDLVLDNQDGRVNLWNETPYQFIKRQSQSNSGQWVDLLDDRSVMVAAAEH